MISVDRWEDSPLLRKCFILDFESYADKDKKELIGIMQKSSKAIYELLENLLEWSGSQNRSMGLKLETKDLKPFCDKIFDLYRMDAQFKNIRLVNEIPSPVMINFDENLTKTILRNLIMNAIKFSYQNSQIRLSWRKSSKGDRQFHVVTVSDEGVGISEEKIQELYANGLPGTTLGTYNEKGNGLGIKLCKDFVTRQGGEIFFESKPGKGVKVSFTIPV